MENHAVSRILEEILVTRRRQNLKKVHWQQEEQAGMSCAQPQAEAVSLEFSA